MKLSTLVDEYPSKGSVLEVFRVAVSNDQGSVLEVFRVAVSNDQGSVLEVFLKASLELQLLRGVGQRPMGPVSNRVVYQQCLMWLSDVKCILANKSLLSAQQPGNSKFRVERIKCEQCVEHNKIISDNN